MRQHNKVHENVRNVKTRDKRIIFYNSIWIDKRDVLKAIKKLEQEKDKEIKRILKDKWSKGNHWDVAGWNKLPDDLDDKTYRNVNGNVWIMRQDVALSFNKQRKIWEQQIKELKTKLKEKEDE